MTLVTVDRLKAYMSGIEVNPDQWQAAEDILAGVEAEIEEELGRPIVVRSFTELLPVDIDGYVAQMKTPIVSVTSVTGSGYPVTFAVSNRGLYVGNWYGTSYFDDPVGAAGLVEVTYTAGLDGANERHLQLEILRVATREMQTRHDDVLSVTGIDRAPGTAPAPLPIGLTDDDRKRLSRWRRRVVA